MVGLPGELVDSVIDQLKTDKLALSACSLVSTQWLPRSRSYRFSSIGLSVDPKYQKEPERVHAFLSLISSPLVTFVPFVRKVHLVHLRELRNKGAQVISPDRILTHLETCGIRPTYLFLNSVQHVMRPFAGRPVFASSLVHLHLEIHNHHIILRSVIDYICAYPLLECVTIKGMPKMITPTKPMSRALPPRLHTMHAGHPLVADWILTLDPVPKQIMTLGLVGFGLEDRWPIINAYLSSTAAVNITSLIFDDSIPEYGIGPDLHHLRCIKHLTVSSSYTRTPRDLLAVLKRLQMSPAAQRLETITLLLGFREETFYGFKANPDWLAVDRVLANTTLWPRLRRITGTTEDDTDDGDRKFYHSLEDSLGLLAFDLHLKFPITSALQKDLSQCHNRGILEINLPVVEPHPPINQQLAANRC
ncbi:hypothetical protein DFH08DRAFT_855339 [Mycena albidolilacea]|uniref:F-box domain-containing protein n=1 Tax=Mycena albidolilacea TaxID=1033008 RepID=A0AAD7AC65_9AGAR|nr:hypothetical protein DFH08DRAFT_855339 [Mycena albidolilacea]